MPEPTYGATHKRRRALLLSRLVDGTPCQVCGQPMRRDMKLDADHSTSVNHGGKAADRLLHSACNRGRGAGRVPVDCQWHRDCGTVHSRAW